MRFSLVLGVTLLAAASAESISYQTLARTIIEDRLRAVANSNKQREQVVRDLFSKAGCPAEHLEETKVRGAGPPNVVCTLPGESESEIVVGAHFDFIDRGRGVIDNWSGASLLPSLLESIDKIPRHHKFVFIAFTAEEEGLIGSNAYVHSLHKEQLAQIRAMVNIDSLGAGPTKVEMEPGDKNLISALDKIAATLKLPLSAVNVHKVGFSDADSFLAAKVPSILIHSLTQETLPILHSPGDRLDVVKWDDYYDSYQLIAAYLAYLDGKLATS